ncbi:class I SAM-dependent methyltransferase [Candidatus Fermentibacteria bacterium]|nr:class I SAM-dependent methyltransferase [Candidatus Fermentibacteria bacterium]
MRWYEELFTNYARTYDTEPYTQGTGVEVDFIEAEIEHNKGIRILDIGCGTGRHAIELARRGYEVTGIDLSETQLARAREKAVDAGVSVQFRQGDARRLTCREEFDLVIMLCEGAFPLMETDEENFAILANAAAALREPGKLILTTLNALFPLFHSVKDFINDQSETGRTHDHHFDLHTFRDGSTFEVTDDDGVVKTLVCNERYYAPCEMTWLLTSLGFARVALFGCPTGGFSRDNALTHDDFEMLVVAEKPRQGMR